MVALGADQGDYNRFARVISRLSCSGVFSDVNMAAVASHLLQWSLAQLSANPPSDPTKWYIQSLTTGATWNLDTNNPDFALLVYHDQHWDAAMHGVGMPPPPARQYTLARLWADARHAAATLQAPCMWAAYYPPHVPSRRSMPDWLYLTADAVRNATSVGGEITQPVLHALLQSGAQQTRTIKGCKEYPFSQHHTGVSEKDIIVLEPMAYNDLNPTNARVVLMHGLEDAWGALRMIDLIVTLPITAPASARCITITLTMAHLTVHYTDTLPEDIDPAMQMLLRVWRYDVLPRLWARRVEKPSMNQRDKLDKAMPYNPELRWRDWSRDTPLSCGVAQSLGVYYMVTHTARKHGDGDGSAFELVRETHTCL